MFTTNGYAQHTNEEPKLATSSKSTKNSNAEKSKKTPVLKVSDKVSSDSKANKIQAKEKKENVKKLPKLGVMDKKEIK